MKRDTGSKKPNVLFHLFNFNVRLATAIVLATCLTAISAAASQQAGQQNPQAYAAPQPPEAPPNQQPVPSTLTLSPGAVIMVRLQQFIASDHTRAGDTFTAVLDQPVVVDGWVVARRGQTVFGSVAVAQKAGHGNKESKLGLELTQLTLVDGQQLPLRTELQQATGGRMSNGHAIAGVAVPTAIGAVIGGAVAGGQGASIGAGAGAAAGLIGVLVTPGKQMMLPPGALLTFRESAPITIATDRSQQAFQPVSPYDYGRGGVLQSNLAAPQGVYSSAPYPPYYYDYYPWWGDPFFPGYGFYGFYGGGGFRGGGFRGGGFRGGGRR